jgi:PIN domain nuclease of toxin-antitoxin system
MKLLLDTQVLLRAATGSAKLTPEVISLIEDDDTEVYFSAISILEIINAQAVHSFDPSTLRRQLLEHGYKELEMSSSHVLCMRLLPDIHDDLFDRAIIAQAMCADMLLLSTRRACLAYPQVQSVETLLNLRNH